MRVHVRRRPHTRHRLIPSLLLISFLLRCHSSLRTSAVVALLCSLCPPLGVPLSACVRVLRILLSNFVLFFLTRIFFLVSHLSRCTSFLPVMDPVVGFALPLRLAARVIGVRRASVRLSSFSDLPSSGSLTPYCLTSPALVCCTRACAYHMISRRWRISLRRLEEEGWRRVAHVIETVLCQPKHLLLFLLVQLFVFSVFPLLPFAPPSLLLRVHVRGVRL